MTRKDYVAVAARIRNILDGNSANGVVLGVSMTAKALADVFALDNPRFDRERFLKAAGVQS